MTRSRQRALFVTLAVAVALGATEGLSLLAILLSRPFLDEEIRTTRDVFREQSEQIRLLVEPASFQLLVFDSLLGWRYRAGYRDSANAINSQGLRSTREYSVQPLPGVVRIAAFGDSFVYGAEVGDSAAWPAFLERLFPRAEVLNYGIGGYGVDQAYLRFCAEGGAVAPHIVIIGFTTDDMRRVVNVYRRFISNREFPLVKPRFTLDGEGDVVYLPSPLRHPSDYERYLNSPRDVFELGANDHWYRAAIYRNPLYDYSATVRLVTNVWLRIYDRYVSPDRLLRHGVFNTSSRAFQIQAALFEEFVAAVRAAGARPIVVIFPDRGSVARARRGQRTILAPLVADLAARGIEHVDLTTAFLDPEAPSDGAGWFMTGGHYSPAGNRLVAEWLGREILAGASVRRSSDAPRLRGPSTAARPWPCPATAMARAPQARWTRDAAGRRN